MSKQSSLQKKSGWNNVPMTKAIVEPRLDHQAPTKKSSQTGPEGGLSLTPGTKRKHVRKSVGELNFAERSVQNVPQSPLARPNTSPHNLSATTSAPRRKEIKGTASSPKATEPASWKRAVLVGANYVGARGAKALKGCTNDVSMLHELLTFQLGFKSEDIWVLTDEPRAVVGAACSYRPTRANIINAMRWLVRNSRVGEQLMFSFSGHGYRVATEMDTKKSAHSNCILPSDYPLSAPIAAEEIHELLVQDLTDGATLTALFNCRYSGKMMQLPYVHVTLRAGRGLYTLCEELEAPSDAPMSTGAVVMNSVLRFSKIKKEKQHPSRKDDAAKRRNELAASCFDNGTVICISTGAEVDEKSSPSADELHRSTLTFAFVSYMRHCASHKEKASYSSVLCAMSSWMAANGEIRLPQFSSSHNLSPETAVSLL